MNGEKKMFDDITFEKFGILFEKFGILFEKFGNSIWKIWKNPENNAVATVYLSMEHVGLIPGQACFLIL